MTPQPPDKSDKGFTFMLCVGPYAGWRVQMDGRSLRITLGWVGLSFIPCDFEVRVGNVVRHMTELEELAFRKGWQAGVRADADEQEALDDWRS